MTTDFSRARLNMVNAQIATNGIHSAALIDAYKALPRENFVGDDLRPYVYMDEEVAGAKGWLLEPMTEARMVQEAVRGSGATGLFYGAGNLPAAVMLAQFLKTVTLVEADADAASTARTRLADAGITNITVVADAGQGGAYDVVFIPGAVSRITPEMTAQLAVGGALICVLRETRRAQGRIVVARKSHDGALDITTGADASTPYLAGFEPAADFVF